MDDEAPGFVDRHGQYKTKERRELVFHRHLSSRAFKLKIDSITACSIQKRVSFPAAVKFQARKRQLDKNAICKS